MSVINNEISHVYLSEEAIFWWRNILSSVVLLLRWKCITPLNIRIAKPLTLGPQKAPSLKMDGNSSSPNDAKISGTF